MGCQVHSGYFHEEEGVGWQVVEAELIWALVLILLAYHDWMNACRSDALQSDCTDARSVYFRGVGAHRC